MEDPFLAEIRFLPARSAPEGWAWCDGREMSIAEYPALFELLGTTYGGNGQSTFALPNLAGRKPVHVTLHSSVTVSGNQSDRPYGLARNDLLSYLTPSYQQTYFCIALQGLLPVCSAD